MEDGTCLIAVLLTSSTFSRSKFPRSFGILSSFKQPDRVRFWREVKLKTILGRVKSLFQSARSSIVRPLKRPIDNGSSFMAVPSNLSSFKCSIFPTISGNFLSFKQPERIKASRESKLMMHGSLVRDLHSFKFNKVSCLRTPMDGWTSYKLTQS
jgi:hypothetical protein